MEIVCVFGKREEKGFIYNRLIFFLLKKIRIGKLFGK